MGELLRVWWVIFKELCECFCDVFLALVRLCFRIEGLAHHSSPDKVMAHRIIHIHGELPVINGRGLAGCHSTSTTIPTTPVPSRPIAPTGIVRCELLFCAN